MKKLNKGFALIELMVVVVMVAIITSMVLGGLSDAKMKRECKEKGGTPVEYLTGEIRDGDSVKAYRCEMPKPKKQKPVNIEQAKESPQYVEWKQKVEGCPKAESRLKTYMYSGKPLGEFEKNDINSILIKTCQQTLTK